MFMYIVERKISHTPYLYYCLYKCRSVHVYSGAKQLVIRLTYTAANIDASLIMSMYERKNKS
jgi:hypothetical protein